MRSPQKKKKERIKRQAPRFRHPDKHRQRLGLAVYHRGKIIAPKVVKGKVCYAYNATNVSDPDPLAKEDRNEQHDWFI